MTKLRPIQQVFYNLMRITLTQILIMVALTSLVSATHFNTSAQEILKRKVSLNVDQVEIKNVLAEIEKQTSVVFTYRPKSINSSRKMSLKVNDATLNDVLNEVFDGAVSVMVMDREEEIVLTPNMTSIQAATVTGTVLDEGGKSMPGVNIVLKGTTVGTTTDVDGKYTLSVPDNNAVLIFSFIGYKTSEIAVNGQTVINVNLDPDVNTLSEIVVVGYGTQKRTSVTGAVASVNAKEITAVAVPSVESALQGRIAGVSVTNSGSPGTNPIVRIRGVGSVTGSSDPLYVVDGFPSGGLNNIDPKDIESVEVLKDAAASAIYGSRAANGVVLITTKKGSKSGKMTVDIDSYYGVQNAWKKLDLLNTDQYLEYANELVSNAGGTLPGRFSQMNDPIYAGATQTYAQTNTDWQDAIFRSAPISSLQASLGTSTENAKLYVSAGYYNQDGIVIGTDFKRYNFRINSELNLNKTFTFGQTMTVATSDRNNLQEAGGRPILMHAIRSVPYLPVYDPTLLKGGYRAATGLDGSDPENPVRIQKMDKNFTKTFKFLGTAYLNVKILPSLQYRFTVGADYSNDRTVVDQPIYADGRRTRSTHDLQDNRSFFYSTLYQNQLTFDKAFGKHSINVIAVGERQDSRNPYLNVTGNQTTNFVNSIVGASADAVTRNGVDETTLLSFLGRVNYEYAGKYLLSASLRRDGFSGFAPGNKWGNFPGVSVGWRMNEEPFMQSVPAISELKLRASYGSVGVNNIPTFAYQSTISANTMYVFGANNRVGGSFFERLPNPDLTWEITKVTNIGVDLGLFDNKVTLSAEYFIRKVEDMLLDAPAALSMGYSQDPLKNIGNMENTGFEIQAGYNHSVGDFNFNLTGNVGVVRNEVIKMAIPGSSISRGDHPDVGATMTRTEAGHAVQGFYGFVTDGIFQNQAEIDAANGIDGNGATKYQAKASPGDIRFKDLNGDGTISDADRKYIGSFLPDFTYGLNFSANYKNFDLTLFIQGVQGNDVYNGTKVITQGMRRLFGAGTEVLRAWTVANPDTNIPRAVDADPNENSRVSDRFVEDGSYLRIKNLNIGYSLPKGLIGSFANGSIKRLRIYASMQNLLTLTNYSGYDPEVGSRTANGLIQGVDYGQYPQPRTIMGGIQIGF